MTSLPFPVPMMSLPVPVLMTSKMVPAPMTAFPPSDFKIVILSHIMQQFHFELSFLFTHWSKHGQKRFATKDDELNFEQGVKLCQEAGGQIATPTSMEENKALTKLIKSDGMAYLVKIINWAPGEPSNDQDDEDYTQLTFHSLSTCILSYFQLETILVL
uniref:Uncharacterized protein n=1 Tax=Erpetoichthys calabaricus TaxID=27687 RepID=A0A8C4RNF6_ERPCA